MGYGICRVEKIKVSSGGELAGRLKHSAREFDEKSEVLKSDDSKTAFQIYKNHLSKVDKKRSDSVGAFEVVCTQSYDPNKTKEEKVEFIRKSLMWADKTFGVSNRFGFFVHKNEKEPHIHIFYTPIKTKKNMKTGKDEKVLCAKDWTGGRERMSNLQDSFYDEVSKNFGLERGEKSELTHRKHQRTTLKYDVDLQKEREQLDKEREILDKLREEINLNSDSVAKLHEWRMRSPEDLEKLASEYRNYNCQNGYELLKAYQNVDTPESSKKAPTSHRNR